jgi:hypothetical protein
VREKKLKDPRFAPRLGPKSVIVNGIMTSVVKLNVVFLCVFMLNVVAPLDNLFFFDKMSHRLPGKERSQKIFFLKTQKLRFETSPWANA